MKYALALAGGGTRGAFQVGVWKALKELGIEISAITGTSIGAVNGALFAMGEDGETLWKNIDSDDVAEFDGDNLFNPSTLISSIKKILDGGIDASAFGDFLSEHINEDLLRAGSTEYGLCTYRTDTKKSEELFLNEIPEGQLIPYILASAAFPLFKPVTINGVEYSDGGIRNNLPENMLIERGYDTIISVSVKGPGFVRPINKSGINIIDISCRTPEVGVMEFDTKAITESIKNGYYECLRVFGAYSGRLYTIDNASYMDARQKYGPDLLNGLEDAARICRIEPYKKYTFDEFCTEIFKSYQKNLRLRLMTSAIENRVPTNKALDSLSALYRAANAIVYLKKHI